MTGSPKNRRPQLNWSALARASRYLLHYKWRFALIIALLLLANVDSIASSLYLQVLIDKYLTPLVASGSHDLSGVAFSVVTMAIIYLVGSIISFLSEYLMIPITQATLRQIRHDEFAKLQTLPLEYFDNNKFGDIMSRLTNDVEVLEELISRGIPNTIMSLTMIVMVGAVMLYQSVVLTLISLVCLGAMFLVSSRILAISGRFFTAHQKSLADTNAFIEEMIGGQKVVKVFAHEKQALADFAVLNEQLASNNEFANRYANILMPVMVSFGNLQYALIGIGGGLLAINGLAGVTIGLIASFLQLSRSLSRQFNQLSQQFNSIAVATAGAARVFALLDEEGEPDEGSITLVNITDSDSPEETDLRTGHWAWKRLDGQGGVELLPLQGKVEFKHVTFAYEPGENVLHDISFLVPAGKKFAFVGHTGAGKTTITNLLNRFYDIQQGEILYDGLDIKSLRKADLRRSLGIILQDTALFTGSVRDNIAYGRLDAPDGAIEAAAYTANAHEFIAHLPEGMQTQIDGAGSDLSQGQRQLLAISRAAVSDPPVMIMDEATSSIDTRTEALIQRGMDNLMAGRTTLVIAHRLSTVRQADQIIVMDHGRIIEQGDHRSLMNQHGTYYQLYTGAFELE